ncbi:MAG TPA: hypothetical protein VGQ62_11225 [Chloroflexota bacterium]|jgi:tripartite-type tricarboxylate transporter receptor subunit TctC|nr:hypothetical protein [Chloroflexota bacterium]
MSPLFIRITITLMALALTACTATPAPAVPTAAPPAAAAATAAPVATAATAAAGAVDFKGKTIHLIVGYSAGGGFDATARLLAPHLQAALTGNPTIVVENMPGADSLLAAKTVLSGPQRGNDINIVVYISTLLVKSVLSGGLDGFLPESESVYLGKPDAAPQTLALCAHKTAVKDLDSFTNLKQPMKVAGLTGSSYYDALLRWSKEVGLPIDPVFGYAATAQMILAFNQGEVDAMPACRDIDLTQNPNWLDNDEITPLFYFAESGETLKKAQAAGKYPWFKHVAAARSVTPEQRTVLDTLNAVNTGVDVYAVSKQTPPATSSALRDGFSRAVQSDAYVKDMNGRQLAVGFQSPDAIDATITTIRNASPDTREFIKRTLGT